MKPTNISLLSEIEHFEESLSDRIIDTASHLFVDDEKLELKGTEIHFYSNIEGHQYHSIQDLADIWVPGSGGFEHPVPLLLYPHHAQTIVKAVDTFAQGVGHTPSFTKDGAPSVLSNAIKFIEWSLLNDHYQLQSISERDIKQLCKDMSNGGVPNLLQIPQRLDNLWNSIYSDIEQVKAILTEPNRESEYKSLKISSIKKLIGTSSLEGMIPNNLYKLIAQQLKSAGVKVHNSFNNKGIMRLEQPSAKTLNTLFGQWNALARQEEGDSIPFLPFKNAYQLSNKLGKPKGRTKTLSVDLVIRLLGEAHLWVYKASPLIIKAVKDLADLRYTKLEKMKAKDVRPYIRNTLYPKQMTSSKTLDDLENIIGLKVYRGGPNGKVTTDDTWTLTECITALMSACYVILQIYNARRQSEISDPVIGISKKIHFRCADEEHGWYQACFYNEKHGGRYWYTLNKSSTKALQTLFDLSDAWNRKGHEGLFNIPRFNIDTHYNMSAFKYHYNKGKDSNYTGDKFLERALGENIESVKGSHIFRRIYAIIYHYQYENSELLALCHQLGHVDPEVTEVYVTDPAARDTHEQIQNKVNQPQTDATSSAILIKEENKALNKVIQEVDIEKTAADILTLLMGTQSMAGRYPAYLKRVFKILRRSVKFNQQVQKEHQATFAELSPQLQCEEMAKVIYKRGHRSQPKPHNTCHRNPEITRSHKAPCDPLQCKGCAFQDVKQTHLDIMKDDLIQLREIAANRHEHMPLERMQALEQAKNLEHVIAQHERTIQSNSSLFTGF